MCFLPTWNSKYLDLFYRCTSFCFVSFLNIFFLHLLNSKLFQILEDRLQVTVACIAEFSSIARPYPIQGNSTLFLSPPSCSNQSMSPLVCSKSPGWEPRLLTAKESWFPYILSRNSKDFHEALFIEYLQVWHKVDAQCLWLWLLLICLFPVSFLVRYVTILFF